jgi:hypothetical protein
MYPVNRLGLSPSLMRCLGSTNIFESPRSGVRLRTQTENLPLAGRSRGAALGRLRVPDHREEFRKIQGHRYLWMLKAVLNPYHRRKSGALDGADGIEYITLAAHLQRNRERSPKTTPPNEP